MANKYTGTQTEKNLEAAFAGESMARNKYTYFASKPPRSVPPATIPRPILKSIPRIIKQQPGAHAPGRFLKGKRLPLAA